MLLGTSLSAAIMPINNLALPKRLLGLVTARAGQGRLGTKVLRDLGC